MASDYLMRQIEEMARLCSQVLFAKHTEPLPVFDEQGNMLGETGLIKPNEYVKYVTLSKTPEVGTKIKLKIMGYEPHTYYSAGAASLNTQIGGQIDQ